MLAKSILSHILDDDALTRGLSDPEARILVEWLVERAEQLGENEPSENSSRIQVKQLCTRARAISRFVTLWCYYQAWGAASQLAAVERFNWPLPVAAEDPCDLMQTILDWESSHFSD